MILQQNLICMCLPYQSCNPLAHSWPILQTKKKKWKHNWKQQLPVKISMIGYLTFLYVHKANHYNKDNSSPCLTTKCPVKICFMIIFRKTWRAYQVILDKSNNSMISEPSETVAYDSACPPSVNHCLQPCGWISQMPSLASWSKNAVCTLPFLVCHHQLTVLRTQMWCKFCAYTHTRKHNLMLVIIRVK